MATEDQVRTHNQQVMRRLLDMKEVAAELHVGRSTAFALVKSRKLRSVRIGRRRLVPAAALAEFLEQLEGED